MSNFYNGTLQYGSEGKEVEEWQNFLIGQGYEIEADGIFGPSTRWATKSYQAYNGLTIDGIVGPDTYAKAGFKDVNTPISAPTIDPAPTAPTFESAPELATFDNTRYENTADGKVNKDAMNDALKKFNQYGENWQYKDQYSTLFEDYIGRDKFNYDLNGDALYQQYKDKYIQQGKMAMQDTMGQASAMTGGYGSSYAQSVGQQAYQNSLDNLNDIVPELYQMAYDRYNQEGADMLNKLGLMDADYERGYNEAKDKYSTASSAYYSAADLYNTDRNTANDLKQADYTNRFNAWQAGNDLKQTDYTNQFNAWDVARQEAWNQANFAEGIRQFEKNIALNERQVAVTEENAKKNSSVDSTGSDTPVVKPDPNKDGTITEEPFTAANTKAVQSFKAAIKTKNEFYSRGGSDKETYKTYEGYIEGILDKWLSQGKLTEDEVATLLVHYGLD